LDNKCETFRKQYRFANNYSKRGKRWWLSYHNTDRGSSVIRNYVCVKMRVFEIKN
jgi:hypothetical protein